MSSKAGHVQRATAATVPTGTVTFLFSDIEGSTQRWDAYPEAMKVAVARHERIVNDAIVRHGGYIFKSLGDAFCAAFHCAPDAVAAACDAQRALAAEDFSSVRGLEVRMGLHAGTAEERNADYFGPTVNRVARLMSIGHGGQVLISGITRDLARDDLPKGASLTDLGLRRLKDLTQPEQVWQLAIAGLRSEFPPLNSLDARANNLPIQVTSLLGREQDLEEVKALLGRHRLVTLSGSGGVGKTRLALQAGADLLDHYPDGVWFADLAPVGDPELVASVIAKTVGMTQAADQRVDEAIPKWLKHKQMLVILDNCEHVLEAVTVIADAILRSCPGVRVLATSRQALGIGGEVVHRVPSLAVPDASAGLSAADALRYGSVLLFVGRAKAADTRFSLTDDTAPVVAEICRRLDGIPLAIELAAARVKVLSIPNLAQRLDERFKILTGGNRTALPRQKTLTALIDWSYALLTAHEQMLFNRAGIFAGAFSLEAATAVCSGEGLDENDVLDLLSSLNDKSLVVADTSGEQERYHLLESTRAYALEKLTAAGEIHRMARCHAEYFRDQAQAADRRYGTGSTAAWLASQEVIDLGNYRAVLKWALSERRDLALGGAVAGALERLWRQGGLTVEGRYWIGLAQSGLDESANPQVAARMWRALCWLSVGKRSEECAQRALTLYRSFGDRHGAAHALRHVAFALMQMGRHDEANAAIEDALAAMREFGDRVGEAACLDAQASIHLLRGDSATARELFAQELAVYKALGNEASMAGPLGNLAEVEFSDGRFSEALRLGSEALAIWLRGKNATDLAICYGNLAAYRIALQDLDGARDDAREALRWARQAQAAVQTSIILQHLSLLGALRGEVRASAQIIGYVNAQFEELGCERQTSEARGYETLMGAMRVHLSELAIEQLAAEGAAWSVDRVVEEALKL